MGFGGLFNGDFRNMAGLAGNGIGMCIDTIITVQLGVMAVRTGDLVLIVQADRGGTATDDMIFGLVTIHALEVVAPHVDIHLFRRVIQAFIQVTVFDRIAATAAEVATTAIFTGGNANTLGCGQQVHAFKG